MSIGRIFIIFSFVLMGCGHAWVISQRPDGGVVGYQGYSSVESATKDVRQLIPCPSYSMVSDDLKSERYQYTAIQNVNTQSSAQVVGPGGFYYASGSQTQQVPVTQNGVRQWREFTYSCSEVSNSSSSLRVPASNNQYNQCNEDCYRRFSNETIKAVSCYDSCK